jgi:hypothetical protein
VGLMIESGLLRGYPRTPRNPRSSDG